MKNLFIYLAILITGNLLSQEPVIVPNSGCDPKGISTNPDNYQNPQDPQKLRKWDWTQEEYTVYLTSNTGTSGTPYNIFSPFFDQSGNLNTFNLANSVRKDFQSADGWELLYQKFGTLTQGINTPYFMLYNRYTGIVRIFVNIINSGEFPYTAAGLRLTLENPNQQGSLNRQTAILNQLGTYTFSNSNLQKNANHFVPNYYTNNGVLNNNFWLYADISTLFDPCTCGLVGDWYFSVGLINNIDVNLEVNGTLKTIVDANPNGNNSDETQINGFFGEIHDYISFGSGIIQGVTGIVNSANKGFTDGVALQGAAQALAANSSTIIGKEKAKNLAKILGRILFEVPKVNMVLNLASTLISTVHKLNNDYNELTGENSKGISAINQPKITETGLEAKVTGFLKVGAPYENTALNIPGSKVQSGQGSIVFTNPIYDEILGVFNLFEQPKFKITKFDHEPNLHAIVDCSPNDPSDPYNPGCYPRLNSEIPFFNAISHLTMENIPKIVLNEAANLDILDVSYQIVFTDYEYFNLNEYQLRGAMLPGAYQYFKSSNAYYPPNSPEYLYITDFYTSPYEDREDYLTSIGLELATSTIDWDSMQLTTPYLKQNCIQNYPIFSYSKILNPQLRVKLILKPKNDDPNSDVDEIILIHTYPGIIENINFQEPYVVSGTPYFDTDDLYFEEVSISLPIDISNLISGYSANSVLQDENITHDLNIIGDIYVNNNVVFGPGNITIKATGNIYIGSDITNLLPYTMLTFQAAKEVIVTPETIIIPEVILEINLNNLLSCQEQVEVFPTTAEIVNFCNGPIYDERSRPTKMLENFENEEKPLKVEKPIIFDFNLFPNPNYGDLTIELTDHYGDEEVVLYDLTGRTTIVNYTRDEHKLYLNLFGLASGIYQIKVSSTLGQVVKPLIMR